MGYYRIILKKILISALSGFLISLINLLPYLLYRFRIYPPIDIYTTASTLNNILYYTVAFLIALKSGSSKRGLLTGTSISTSREAGKQILRNITRGQEEYLFSRSAAFSKSFLIPFQLPDISFVDIAVGISISILAGYLCYLNKLLVPLKHPSSGKFKTVYVLRDYWSNRQLFGKNVPPEEPRIDLSEPGEYPRDPVPELIVAEGSTTVDVVSPTGEVVASGLLNPEILVPLKEPVWNPLPLVFEEKMRKYSLPIFILAMLSIFALMYWELSLLYSRTISIFGPITSIIPPSPSLTVLLGLFSKLMYPSVVLTIILILAYARVNRIKKMKPETSLALTLYLLLSPIIILSAFQASFIWITTANMGLANMWTILLIIPTIVLALTAIRIRAFEKVTVYLYDNTESRVRTFRFAADRPAWLKADYYWVLRYMYFWPAEITFPLPHIDWERLELWINARNGAVEWVVTDYHYRELWYEILGRISRIIVDFDPNFHTPLPVTFEDEYEYILSFLNRGLNLASYIKAQLKLIFKGQWMNLWTGTIFESPMRREYSQLHPADFIQKIVKSKLLSMRLASLHWKKWRYPLGADRKDLYSVTGRNYPATQEDIILVE